MTDMPVLREAARAKINVSLHIAARREDGYHTLDSLITFLDIHDVIEARLQAEGALTLTITGAFGTALSETDNLMLRAAKALRNYADVRYGAALQLDKRLPVGAGIGGGSADAAATLRVLNRLWRLGYSDEALRRIAEPLGADVPACIGTYPVRMQGIGERLSPVRFPAGIPVLLVHPGEPLWTADVYKTLKLDNFSGTLPDFPAAGAVMEEWIGWLQKVGNDLEPPAKQLCPAVGKVLEELRVLEGCRFARMSGSGSACFAFFANKVALHKAEQQLQARFPAWWVQSTATR